MAIEIIDTLKQKNNGSFPLVDSNDIKGGYYQVDSIEDRDNIPQVRRKEGMLCYVPGQGIYQLEGGLDNSKWVEFSTGGLTEHNHNDLYYLKEQVYTVNEIDKKFTDLVLGSGNIPVGDTPPVGDAIVWIDTSEVEDSEPITEDIIDEIRSIFSHLQEKINELNKKNVELEARISYLEINGSPGGGGGTVEGTVLTLEDNSILTLEDDSILILE